MTTKIAVVGTGLVGRAWAIVFARAGYTTVLFDPIDGVATAALDRIGALLPDLAAADLLGGHAPSVVLDRLRVADSLTAALEGAAHVQESAPERVEVKRALYLELDRIAAPTTVLASSTSGIPASQFTEPLAGRARCLVAHPINPPHIIPLVEIVPAPWTDPAVVERTRELMAAVGQRPISTTREIDGFVVNRLQGALLGEAFRLVEDGVCSVADVDAAIADGLGLRWSFIGPFETIDLNSPRGVRGYCEMLGPLYHALALQQADPREWSEALVAEVERQRRAALPLDAIAERQAWRDRRLAKLVGHKRGAD
ncbi:MAG: 3-hydroxyacyl-CoA dehydrogenase [Ectothiorhodospiraceae bacterium]|nr:3-hydroxyacyl-CoA dehydrogenase [Ectothiorhodospiraceae bacterium]